MAAALPPVRRGAPADLPLDQADTGTRFVTLVVVMMTALATLATGGALVVQELRASWAAGMAGHMTIEIPAKGGAGALRGPDALEALAQDVRAALEEQDGIASVRVLTRAEVEDLVAPWLGEGAGGGDLPLPALVAVTLEQPGDADAIAAIAATAREADEAAITETHQSWLSDLRRFSLALLLAAAGMAGVTVACCILTVAGAVRARLEAHAREIDLLHVMGATDDYIGAQFVRVVVRNVGGAALLGTAAGLIFLKIGGMVAGGLQSAMLPAFRWDLASMAWFAAIPALVTALCWGAARFTVLRSLRVMP